MFRQKKGKDFATPRKMKFLGPAGRNISLQLRGKVITIGGRKYVQCFMRKARK